VFVVKEGFLKLLSESSKMSHSIFECGYSCFSMHLWRSGRKWFLLYVSVQIETVGAELVQSVLVVEN